jgi:hypothetical protein
MVVWCARHQNLHIQGSRAACNMVWCGVATWQRLVLRCLQGGGTCVACVASHGNSEAGDFALLWREVAGRWDPCCPAKSERIRKEEKKNLTSLEVEMTTTAGCHVP